jgi:hypothetical protein
MIGISIVNCSKYPQSNYVVFPQTSIFKTNYDNNWNYGTIVSGSTWSKSGWDLKDYQQVTDVYFINKYPNISNNTVWDINKENYQIYLFSERFKFSYYY